MQVCMLTRVHMCVEAREYPQVLFLKRHLTTFLNLRSLIGLGSTDFDCLVSYGTGLSLPVC